ncbi:LOW QUALITY PROTEIN: hypothetical protein U9M48_004312 [Paspalum notatum var. saurae]|uniref:Reverse transcriptase/retrotransposon-derived protein RNase H-like domain-containing protein n=1 Tax=Paspalum notatum var. saurae TaxID=547442 RepID=A0AAQ3PKB6_PASNO
MMGLLDGYSGYHQIWLRKEDEPKTSFITPLGTYCYIRMPEGLKNAGGSFNRMTTKVVRDQLGRNDLWETFINFRKAGPKLNPEKRIFGILKGKFLSCLVSTKGIEANPTKIEAVLKMEPPKSKKSTQLTALNWFISRSAEKRLPFFERNKPVYLGEKQKPFEDLKSYLIHLTTQSPPVQGAPLLLYVAAAPSVVSAVLAQEREVNGQKKQRPIYYVSEALTPTKMNYLEIEKIIYAVVMASRKLHHYFQTYNIIVPSSQPLRDVL